MAVRVSDERGVAEVKLNGDTARLNALLRNEALTAHWRRFGSDSEVMFPEV